MEYGKRLIGHIYPREKPVSELAISIGKVFDDKGVEQPFFDQVFAQFENFDESYQAYGNKTLLNDLEHIIERSAASLKSDQQLLKFPNRIDSYFYIDCGISKYLTIAKQSTIGPVSAKLKNFREQFYEKLTKIFSSTKGAKPTLCITDKYLLEQINISQHLTSCKDIKDTKTIDLFFVLCKLSLQASSLIDNYNRLQWIDLISGIESLYPTLQYFCSKYIEYKNAFVEFPLDMPAFVHMIRKFHPPKSPSPSPFSIFVNLQKNLEIDDIYTFLKHFQPVFEICIKDNRYYIQQVGDFIRSMGRLDHTTDTYLSIYSSNVDVTELWKMFLYLSKTSDLNDILKKHLILNLKKHVLTVSISTFTQMVRSAQQSEKDVQIRAHFQEILEAIVDSFIEKKCREGQYSRQLSSSDFKQLFEIRRQLSSANNLKQPGNLIMYQYLLFTMDAQVESIVERIKQLFQKLNDLDENLYKNNNPAGIIQDEWLQDYIVNIPQGWLNFDQNSYQNLCNNHRNNQWTIYIWSRIVQLSLLQAKYDNPNEMLLQLNEWLKNIRHDKYDTRDVLTIIFVINLFDIVIVKYMTSLLSLPYIESIVHILLSAAKENVPQIKMKQVNDFSQNAQLAIQDVLLLKGTRSMYRELLNGSIVSCFLPLVDIKKILSPTNPQYKFPIITPKIDSVIPGEKPKDINITNIEPKEQFFARFITQVNEWLQWFDNFIEIFQHIVEWLKICQVEGAGQLFIDLHRIGDDSTTTFIQTRITVEKTLKILKPFSDLRRLCHLFNCLNSFQIIESGAMSNENEFNKYMKDIKRLQPNNSFVVDSKKQYITEIPINDRQHVHWSIGGEKHLCNIKVEYQIDGSNDHCELLFSKNAVPIHKYVLHGEFETQKSGCLLITIDNQNIINPLTIWFRVVSVGLSTCHLFHGIFNMLYQKYYNQQVQIIKEDQLSRLLDQVFQFIDKLLNGSITLREMANLKVVFCDKNIRVRDEVRKLFTSRSTVDTKQRTTAQNTTVNAPSDQEIEQVCEWLQIYQYYSHVSIIIDCIQKFDILPNDTDDEAIGHLQRLGSNEDCSLKQITQAYKILHQRFQNLASQHLQLIKMAVECSAVVQTMKKADLYSIQGQRRFQELRDNLTTQFQLQERNNMILNSWIITYALCEPFALKARNLDEFIVRIARLPNIDESSSRHMKVVNDNIQIVSMWLSTEETTALDNALITMEHLYKTGLVKIHLRRLMNEQSYFEIEYSIDKIQVNNEETENEKKEREPEKIQFILSMSDIDDHKRQLTFCNVDLKKNMFDKKILLNEQLRLLQIIEKIYLILIKLEMTGHPDYQLREENYNIHDRTNTINIILDELKKNPNINENKLEQAVKVRTDNFQSTYRNLEGEYNRWIENLERYRQENPLLKLFSNRQVMILIILLTTTTEQNQIKSRFP